VLCREERERSGILVDYLTLTLTLTLFLEARAQPQRVHGSACVAEGLGSGGSEGVEVQRIDAGGES